MEEYYVHPLLKNKKSQLDPSQTLRRDYTSPNLEAYQKMTERYKKYLDGLGSKIDKICEK